MFIKKMMDRNTIIALLLITLVLVVTPYYLELLSPTQPEKEVFEEELYSEPDNKPSPVNPNTKESDFSMGLLGQKTTEEKITTIESVQFLADLCYHTKLKNTSPPTAIL